MSPRLFSNVFCACFLGCFATTEAVAAGKVADVSGWRTNLFLFRDSTGVVQRVQSVNDWQRRRSQILSAMQEVMGALPGKEKRCLFELKVLSENDAGDHIRQDITYQSEPGSRVPAYLLIPKGAGVSQKIFPAVLALHQTHPLGRKVVVGLGNSPNDEYGVELVRRGFVVLAPAYPLLADYQPDLKALGYVSGTMKAVWDNVRGLDLLESLPFVQRDGFGVIGHSLGGHNGIYTAAFDSRIKVIISSCGFDSFSDYMNGNIQGWTSDRYMPRLRNYERNELPFDFHEIIATLAPRDCFVNAPLGDTNFKWRSVDAVADAARPIFQLYGRSAALQVEHPDCGHQFPKAQRENAYRILLENFNNKKTSA